MAPRVTEKETLRAYVARHAPVAEKELVHVLFSIFAGYDQNGATLHGERLLAAIENGVARGVREYLTGRKGG